MIITMITKWIRTTLFFGLLPMMAMWPSAATASSTIYVDVNGDGEVNIADVNVLIDYILTGESASPIDMNKNYLSARDFGAVGDGETDDTDALESLFETAFLLKKAVFFDPGTYLIRRSLLLRSGMEVFGEDATIKKRSAVTTTLTEPAVVGQTYVDVTSADGFNVGDQFYIHDNNGANRCTYAIVTGIEGNRINFTNIISDQQSNYPGCIFAYDTGTKVSTSFALLRSWSTRFDCDGVYIHDLTLDGNRKSKEPTQWSNSCIHLDSYYPGGYTGSSTGIEYRNVQRDMVIRNVVIKNSPCDAISDQGAGGLIVRDCVIENPAVHGVHMGTIFNAAVISDNTMTGSGITGAGVFFCQEVSNVIVDNNTISSFNHGCSDEENGTAARYVTIRNNVFKDIYGYVFDFLKAMGGYHGYGLQVSDNQIVNLKSMLFSGRYLDNVIISGNTVTSVAQQPSRLMRVSDSRNVVIAGNTVPASASWDDPLNLNESVNVIQDSNSWNN